MAADEGAVAGVGVAVAGREVDEDAVVVEEEERGAVSRRPSRAACGLTKMMTIEKEKRKKEGQASEVSYEMSKNFQKSHRSKIKLVTAYVEYSFNSSACACTSSIRACISSSPFPMEVHPPPLPLTSSSAKLWTPPGGGSWPAHVALLEEGGRGRPSTLPPLPPWVVLLRGGDWCKVSRFSTTSDAIT